MEQPNWWLILVVAVIPLIIGLIWYNPVVFGKTWKRTAEISEEQANSGNAIKIYLFTYLFSILAAYILTMVSVHQSAIFQLFLGEPALQDSTTAIGSIVNDFMTAHGNRHRSFGHGVIHGVELALFLGLPFIGIHSLFERRPFKYVLIHVGFWMVCFGIMGGLVCAYF